MRTFFLFACVLLLQSVSDAFPQPDTQRMTREEYIEKFKDDAVRDMLSSGVPASITLAQALLESDNGNSRLAQSANNHFGIKCHLGWNGETYIQDDDAKDECFRKYNSVLESYDDHSAFLKSRPRYAFLFEISQTDYRGWAEGLKKAGYATNPNYPQLLIKIIEDNKLYELDKLTSLPSQVKGKVRAGKAPAVISQPDPRIKINNRVKFIIAETGESYLKIATRYEMGPWQLYRYNEVDRSVQLREGDIVYLQPKRRKSKEIIFHMTVEGETMYAISQKYAVKLRQLYKLNHIPYGKEVKPGQKLILGKSR